MKILDFLAEVGAQTKVFVTIKKRDKIIAIKSRAICAYSTVKDLVGKDVTITMVGVSNDTLIIEGKHDYFN